MSFKPYTEKIGICSEFRSDPNPDPDPLSRKHCIKQTLIIDVRKFRVYRPADQSKGLCSDIFISNIFIIL